MIKRLEEKIIVTHIKKKCNFNEEGRLSMVSFENSNLVRRDDSFSEAVDFNVDVPEQFTNIMATNNRQQSSFCDESLVSCFESLDMFATRNIENVESVSDNVQETPPRKRQNRKAKDRERKLFRLKMTC